METSDGDGRFEKPPKLLWSDQEVALNSSEDEQDIKDFDELDFDDLGFKFYRGKWVSPTVQTYNEVRYAFGNIGIELAMRHSPAFMDIYKATPYLDMEWEYNKKKSTPDIVYPAESNNPDVYEFKTYFHEPHEDEVARQQKYVLDTYGPKAKLVIIVLDNQFPSRYKLKKFESKLFYTLRKEMTGFLNKNKVIGLVELRYSKRRMPDKDILLERTFLTKDLDFDLFKDVQKEFDSMENIVTSFKKFLPQMEKFVNNNFLDSADLAKFIPKIKPEVANIFGPHFWDRDLNRMKTSEIRGKETKHGHRAEYLMKMPIDKHVQKGNLTEDELNEIGRAVQSRSDIHPSIQELVLAQIGMETTNKETHNRLKQLNDDIAFLETEAPDTYVEIKSLERGLKNKTKAQMIDIIGNERYQIVENLRNLIPNVVGLTNRGGVTLKTDHTLKKKTGIGMSKVGGSSSKDEHSKIAFDGPEFDFDVLADIAPQLAPWKPDLNDSYTHSPTLRQFVNDVNKGSLSDLNQVLTSKQFGLIAEQWYYYKSYTAGIPQMETKGDRPKVFSRIKINDRKVMMFSSPCPNEITTGSIFHIAIVEKGYEFPKFAIPHKYIHLKDKTVAISDFYRENLKSVHLYEEHVGAYLGFALLQQNIGTNFHKDWLLTSFFITFVRQLKLTLDLLYLYYKNIFAVGTLGLYEIEKKFKLLEYRDVRVQTVFRRLIARYETGVKDYRSLLNSSERFLIKDPIFNKKHSTLQSLLSIIYLKQALIKDDGFDDTKYAWGFFCDELGFEEEWLKSQFHPSLIDPLKSMSLDHFFKLLFIDEKSWSTTAYHPDTCYRMSQLFLKEALQKDELLTTKTFPETPAIKTGKSTKVLYPATEENQKEIPNTEKTKYEGVASLNLTEALYCDSVLLERELKDPSDDSPFKDPDIEYTTGGTSPSLLEMTCFESKFYPKAVVLMMVNKIQADMTKRNFFVQPLFSRNINKIRDESLRPILKTINEDFILTPGPEKYVKLEREAELLGHQEKKRSIESKDQTKFGDMYPMQVFKIGTKALFDMGYYNEEEAKMLIYSDECIENRFILMPASTVKKYIETKKNRDTELMSDLEQRISRVIEQYGEGILESNDRFSTWKNGTVLDGVRENPGFKKTVGFTLGVLNITGSFFSAGHARFINLVWNSVGENNPVKTSTHSDDSITITGFDVPSADLFKELVFDKEHIRDLFCVGGTLFGDPFKGYNVVTITDKVGRISSMEASKINFVIGLFTPRLFGQRPSLLKWQIGDVGEVLQVMIIQGKVIVPLVRHAVAIAKDLPSHSPGEDLQMAAGRVYEVLTNGGGSKLTNDLILAINWIVSRKFGIDDFDLKINNTPQFLGIWYAFPPFLLSAGFNSNEARLWSNAVRDEQIMRHLHLTMNLPSVWKQKEPKNPETSKISTLKSMVDFGDGDLDIRGAAETRRDFKLRFNRRMKTSKAFVKLVNLFRPLMMELVQNTSGISKEARDELMKMDSGKLVRELTELWVPYSMGTINNLAIQSTFFMSKYLTSSYQESYARVNRGTKLVFTLGYMKHKMPNPFSDEANMIVDLPDVVEIRQVFIGLEKLERSNFAISDRAKKFGQLHSNVLSNYISEINSCVVAMASQTKIERNIEHVLKYVKIEDKRTIRGLTFRLTDLLSVYLEMKLYKKPLNETTVVKQKPLILGQADFNSTLKMLEAILHNAGFTAQVVVDHLRLVVRALTIRDFQAVVKAVSEHNILEQYFTTAFSYQYEIDAKVYVSEINEFVERQDMKFELATARAFALGLMHLSTLNSDPFSKSEINISVRGRMVQPPTVRKANSDLMDRYSGKIVTEWFVAVLLKEHETGKQYVTFYRDRKGGHKRFGINFGDDIMHGEVFEDEEGDLSYLIQTNSNQPHTVIPLLKILFYFMCPKSFRPKVIPGDLRSKTDKNGDFSVFGNVLSYRPGTGNSDIIYNSRENIELKMKTYFSSINKIYYHSLPMNIIERKYHLEVPVKEYAVVPWAVTENPTYTKIDLRGINTGLRPFSETLLDEYHSPTNSPITGYWCKDGGFGSKKFGWGLERESDDAIYSFVPIDTIIELVDNVEKFDKFIKQNVSIPVIKMKNILSLSEIRRFEVLIAVPLTILFFSATDKLKIPEVKVIGSKKTKRGKKEVIQKEETTTSKAEPIGFEVLFKRLRVCINDDDFGNNWIEFSYQWYCHMIKKFNNINPDPDYYTREKLNESELFAWADLLKSTADDDIYEWFSNGYELPADTRLSRDFRFRFFAMGNLSLSLVQAYFNATENCNQIAPVFSNKELKKSIPMMDRGSVDKVLFKNIVMNNPDCEMMVRSIVQNLQLV